MRSAPVVDTIVYFQKPAADVIAAVAGIAGHKQRLISRELDLAGALNSCSVNCFGKPDKTLG